jgi:hypothetical protein
MPNTTKIILCGPVDTNENPSYWNNDSGWIVNETEATIFDHRILTAPLPEGIAAIMEIHNEKVIHFYSVMDLTPSGYTPLIL